MAERDDDEDFDLGISLESVAAIVDAARAVQEGEESGAIARDEEDEEGRGAEFEEARTLAKERNIRDPADYLLGIDMLGDMLEEGLAELGLSLEDADGS
jgi:hypothetical protein